MPDSAMNELTTSLQAQYRALSEITKRETDRGVALTYSAFLEDCLEQMLRHHFKIMKRSSKITDPLFDGFGPLATFSGKIAMSYSFSLLSNTLERNLTLIRKIRNEFAHQVTCGSFAAQKIDDWVGKLTGDEKMQDSLKELEDKSFPVGLISRTRFVWVCERIIGFLQASVIVSASDIPIEGRISILNKFGESSS